LGLRKVTRVMPVICFRPSLARALRAFFSPRECTLTLLPAGMDAPWSPWSPWSWPACESSESESASSTVGWLTGASSVISSIFDIYYRQRAVGRGGHQSIHPRRHAQHIQKEVRQLHGAWQWRIRGTEERTLRCVSLARMMTVLPRR